MIKTIALIIIITISISLLAQTQVSGAQSGTWTVDNSPYQVIGEILVNNGQTLTIEAGVEVNFQGHYKFVVEGNLQAIGTETDSIFFTTDNQAIGWGGIRFNNSYQAINNLSYCRIEFGKTAGNYPDIHGGAVALLSSNAVFSNCIFADNDATAQDNGMGGAVYAINTGSSSGALTYFTDCKFLRNHAYGEGGAIKFTSDMNTEITGCTFIENNCRYGGGAISFYSVLNTKMTNCLFANNYTLYSNGGAIHTLGMGNSIIFQNCTISGNSANGGDGGAVSLAYASANFVNSIIYDNPGMYSDGIYLDFSSSAVINYCDLTMPSGASGSNNIDENPLFADVSNLDFHLTETSPCINAGTDIGLEYFGEAPDMGCYEWEEVGSGNEQIIENHRKIKNYPNPFNPSTTISFSVTQNSDFVNLSIYNVKGQKIKSIIYNELNKGKHSVVWNGDDENEKPVSSGIYLYKLNVNGKTEAIKKCLLLK